MKDTLITLGMFGAAGVMLAYHDRYERMISVATNADANGMVPMLPYQFILMIVGFMALIFFATYKNYQDTKSRSRFAQFGGWIGVATLLFVAVGATYKLIEALQ